jgi:hypothetical protein
MFASRNGAPLNRPDFHVVLGSSRGLGPEWLKVPRTGRTPRVGRFERLLPTSKGLIGLSLSHLAWSRPVPEPRSRQVGRPEVGDGLELHQARMKARLTVMPLNK